MDFAQSRRNEDTSYRTSHTLSVPTIKSLGFIVSEKIFIVSVHQKLELSMAVMLFSRSTQNGKFVVEGHTNIIPAKFDIQLAKWLQR